MWNWPILKMEKNMSSRFHNSQFWPFLEWLNTEMNSNYYFRFAKAVYLATLLVYSVMIPVPETLRGPPWVASATTKLNVSWGVALWGATVDLQVFFGKIITPCIYGLIFFVQQLWKESVVSFHHPSAIQKFEKKHSISKINLILEMTWSHFSVNLRSKRCQRHVG